MLYFLPARIYKYLKSVPQKECTTGELLCTRQCTSIKAAAYKVIIFSIYTWSYNPYYKKHLII